MTSYKPQALFLERYGLEKNRSFKIVCAGKWVNDDIFDDQSLIISVDKDAFFPICGCCHSGVIDTLHWAKRITGRERLVGVIGGLHLIGANEGRLTYVGPQDHNPAPLF